MPVTVYGMYLSPPVRTVLITSKLIGLQVDLKVVNLLAREHKSPEFLKLNPLHTVPVIDDNGIILFESHALVPYLVSKYGKDDQLYPKDLVTRAIVDQRLHFDNNTMFLRLKEKMAAILPGGDITEDLKQRTRDTLTSLSLLLGDNDWIAHTKSYTIADICLLSTIENIEWLQLYLQDFPSLKKWQARARKTIPGYEEITNKGKSEFEEVILSKRKA